MRNTTSWVYLVDHMISSWWIGTPWASCLHFLDSLLVRELCKVWLIELGSCGANRSSILFHSELILHQLLIGSRSWAHMRRLVLRITVMLADPLRTNTIVSRLRILIESSSGWWLLRTCLSLLLRFCPTQTDVMIAKHSPQCELISPKSTRSDHARVWMNVIADITSVCLLLLRLLISFALRIERAVKLVMRSLI